MKTYTEPPHYCVLTLTIYVLTTFFLPSLTSHTHLYDPVVISASFPFPILAELVCVTEHGEELPLPSVFDDDDPSGISQPKLHDCHTSPSSHSDMLM